jgi:hypothetical protein
LFVLFLVAQDMGKGFESMEQLAPRPCLSSHGDRLDEKTFGVGESTVLASLPGAVDDIFRKRHRLMGAYPSTCRQGLKHDTSSRRWTRETEFPSR